MKRTVKILALLVITVLMASVLMSGAFAADIVHSGSCGSNCQWTLDSDGVLTVTGSGTLGVGPGSDYADQIKKAVISGGITAIGEFAFMDYTQLAEVSLPSSVTLIDEGAFRNCEALTDITIPSSVKKMGGNVFYGCTSLRHLTIPDSVTQIGNAAFSYSGIETIKLSANIDTISGYEFYECRNLKSLDIPRGVTLIRCDSFGSCVSLESVTIPSTVKKIEGGAFVDCTALKYVFIPSSVTEIEATNFARCASLTEIEVSSYNDYYSSDSRGVLFNKSKTKLIQAPGGLTGYYTMPNSVTSMSSNAFQDCDKMTGVSISSGLSTIASGAFISCEALESVSIPSSVTKIDYSCFIDCVSLRSIDLPRYLYTIGDGAFMGSGLESVFIPSGVSTVGVYAFRDCKNLTAIHCSDYNDYYYSDGVSLYNYSRTRLIQVPAGLTGLYTVRSSVTRIGDCAFGGCDKLGAIKFTTSAPEFSDYSFDGVTAYGLYPATYMSWSNVRQDYGGNITWVGINPDSPIDWRPLGDITGDYQVSNSDLVTLARFTVGLYADDPKTYSEVTAYADMDKNGEVDNADLVMLARLIVGIE